VYTTALMLMVLPVSALCKTVAHAMSGLHRVVIGQAVDMLIRPLTVLVIVAVVFVAWPHQREPHAAMAAQFLGAFTVLMVGLLVLRRFLPEESRDAVPEYRSREWLKSALPFTLIGGAGILNNQADIIMLGWLMTSEDVGVYRVAVQGATLVLFGFQAINAVVSPQFARFYAQGDMVQLQRTVTLSTRVILVITLPLVLFFIAGSQYIINFLFGESYLASYYPLSVLILGQFSVATIGLTGPLVSMAGYEHLVAKAMWVSAVSNVILNSIMIPYWGLIGAAIATSVTLTVWHIFLFWISLSEMGIWCLPVFVRKANKNESM
jgi:O-antigen/teichoic acid export membrane protein